MTPCDEVDGGESGCEGVDDEGMLAMLEVRERQGD